MACVSMIALLSACGDDGGANDTDLGNTDPTSTTPSTSTSTTTSSETSDPSSTTTSGSTTASSSTAADTGTTDGSSSTGPTPQGEPRLYVSGGNAVSVWAIDRSSGELSEVQRLDQGSSVGPLAVQSSGFLYAARGQSQSVASLAVDPITGALTELGVTPVGHNPVYLAVDTTDGWLFTADFGADLVQVYPLGADGVVGGTPSENRTVQARPHAILQDPGGGYVFVPHRDAAVIEQYVFDSVLGTLTPNEPPSVAAPDGSGPRHLVFAPDSSFAYCVNEFTSSVTVYAYDDTTGLLTQGDTHSALPRDFVGDNTGADVHVSFDGRFVYASMRGHDSIAMFGTRGDGGLNVLGNAPTEPRPRDFGLGPFGEYLYVAGQDSGRLAGYAIEADGLLTTGSTYEVGSGPLWVLGVELPLR